jgi:uncharacterized protein (TIGR03437 family)
MSKILTDPADGFAISKYSGTSDTDKDEAEEATFTKSGAESVDLHHQSLQAAIRDNAALSCVMMLGYYGIAVCPMAVESFRTRQYLVRVAGSTNAPIWTRFRSVYLLFSGPSEDPMSKLFLLALGAFAAAASAQPVVTAVLNGASYTASLSPGCWVAIYGTNLAPSEMKAPSVPLTNILNGVSVDIGGKHATLLYVSPTQVNALIPMDLEIPTDLSVSLSVTSPQGTSVGYPIRVESTSPAIFTRTNDGRGAPHLYDASYRPVTQATPGQRVFFYAAGLGQTDPPGSIETGGAAGEPLNRVLVMPEVWIGDIHVLQSDIAFAGLAPGFPGVYQVNVRVPDGVSTNRFFLRSGTQQQGNVAALDPVQGSAVSNVQASIESLFPPSNPEKPPFNIPSMDPQQAASFSVSPVVAAITLSFDISPDAKPFDLVATGGTGILTVHFNPAAGTYDALMTVPPISARSGNFSTAGLGTIWDFYSCHNGAVCSPFPSNIVPVSRLDPTASYVLRLLPYPNSAGGSGGLGLYISSGTAKAGSHFVIDADNNSALRLFGGWMKLEWGPFAEIDCPVSVYVDGKLAASITTKLPVAHR